METHVDSHKDLHSEQGALRGEHPGRSRNPLIKVRDLAWLEFEKPDLVRAEAFARAFGFTTVLHTADELHLRGTDAGSPWSLCRRPWSLMYFTANGRALPCCIAPFSQHGYDNYMLGDATQQTLREIWNGPAYREFRKALLSDKPPAACANCGLRWSL